MQPLSFLSENVGALVFVRSTADLPLAVHAVSAFLATRSSGEDVLAILAGAGLEPPSLAQSEVALRESVELVGLWSVSWFELGPCRLGQHARDRRCHMLDLILPGLKTERASSDSRGTLFPIFTYAEARRGFDPILDELADRYPHLTMGRDTFVHDPVGGGILRLPAAPSAAGLH